MKPQFSLSTLCYERVLWNNGDTFKWLISYPVTLNQNISPVGNYYWLLPNQCLCIYKDTDLVMIKCFNFRKKENKSWNNNFLIIFSKGSDFCKLSTFYSSHKFYSFENNSVTHVANVFERVRDKVQKRVCISSTSFYTERFNRNFTSLLSLPNFSFRFGKVKFTGPKQNLTSQLNCNEIPNVRFPSPCKIPLVRVHSNNTWHFFGLF